MRDHSKLPAHWFSVFGIIIHVALGYVSCNGPNLEIAVLLNCNVSIYKGKVGIYFVDLIFNYLNFATQSHSSGDTLEQNEKYL